MAVAVVSWLGDHFGRLSVGLLGKEADNSMCVTVITVLRKLATLSGSEEPLEVSLQVRLYLHPSGVLSVSPTLVRYSLSG